MKHADNCQCPKCLIYLEEPDIIERYSGGGVTWLVVSICYLDGVWFVKYTATNEDNGRIVRDVATAEVWNIMINNLKGRDNAPQ